MGVWQRRMRADCVYIATILRLIASYKQVGNEIKCVAKAQFLDDLKTIHSK